MLNSKATSVPTLGQKGRNVRWPRRLLLINHKTTLLFGPQHTDRETVYTDGRTPDRWFTLSIIDAVSTILATSVYRAIIVNESGVVFHIFYVLK